MFQCERYIRQHNNVQRSAAMNPYQVMGVIACCTLIFAGVVSFLTVQGMPLLMAFLGVYLLAVWIMVGMQRRARQLFEANSGHRFQRSDDREVIAPRHLSDSVVDADDTFGRHRHLQM